MNENFLIKKYSIKERIYVIKTDGYKVIVAGSNGYLEIFKIENGELISIKKYSIEDEKKHKLLINDLVILKTET